MPERQTLHLFDQEVSPDTLGKEWAAMRQTAAFIRSQLAHGTQPLSDSNKRVRATVIEHLQRARNGLRLAIRSSEINNPNHIGRFFEETMTEKEKVIANIGSFLQQAGVADASSTDPIIIPLASRIAAQQVAITLRVLDKIGNVSFLNFEPVDDESLFSLETRGTFWALNLNSSEVVWRQVNQLISHTRDIFNPDSAIWYNPHAVIKTAHFWAAEAGTFKLHTQDYTLNVDNSEKLDWDRLFGLQ